MTEYTEHIHRAERSPGLDVARTLGISGVLAAHLTLFLSLFGYTMEEMLPIHIWGGFFGVELFFALSGLLIGEILFRDVFCAFSMKKVYTFLTRRWLRTLPAYYVVLSLVALMTVSNGGSIDTLWKYLFFIQNTPPEYASFFGVSWSLSIEQWSYIIIPFFLIISFFLYKRSKTYQREQYFLFMLLFIIVASLLARMLVSCNSLPWDGIFRKQVLIRIDAVSFGIIIAWIKIFHPELYKKLGSGYFFCIIVFFLYILSKQYTMTLFEDAENFFIKTLGFTFVDMLLAFSLIFLDSNVLVKKFFAQTTSTGKFFLYGSRYAYSLYLVHATVFLYILGKLSQDTSTMYKIGSMLLALLISLGLSVLLYHSIEKPFMNMRKEIS